MRPPRLMLLESAPGDREWLEALRRADPRTLCVRLEKDLGGVWTDYTPDGEILRIGYPANAQTEYFRIFAPRSGKPTAASVALERTVFAQGITDVVCIELPLFPLASHAFSGSDVYVWSGSEPLRPSALAGVRTCEPNREAMLDALRQRMVVA